ncbi:calcineurin B homologous protein 2 [Nothobranchius furzeri]|uniref:Calcineurin B homologous protein 2-like n=1 Tax=Nothobranchius furzeri TaxID=105023 RepID=A0A1A7ZQ14_NOTFU|nr:calcineurin B homologous protein 2-like [Nothobranchius furzeri]
MGSCSSNVKNVPNAQKLVQETGFSSSHLLRLYERFESLDRENRGHLRKEDFQAVRELSMNPVGDRIIGSFFSPGQETVDFPSFVQVLAHFRHTENDRIRDGAQKEPANSTARRLKFVFQLYDQDRDGKISRAELLQVLREMLGMQVTEEQLQSIAERAIQEANQEANQDKDDAISFDEFRKSMEKVNIDHKMSIRFLE